LKCELLVFKEILIQDGDDDEFIIAPTPPAPNVSGYHEVMLLIFKVVWTFCE